MQPTYISIDLDALTQAYEQATQAHPDTNRGWGKAIVVAYEYLMDVWADQGAVEFDGIVMLVPSATELGTIHRANGGCDCPSGERAAAQGEKVACWHRACRQLVCRMREIAADRARHAASAQAMAQRLAARRAETYRQMDELFG